MEVRNFQGLRVLIIALTFTLTACAEDIRQEVYTTDTTAQVRSGVLNSDLSDDDKRSFEQEVVRDGYQPYGKTVATNFPTLKEMRRPIGAQRP